MADAGRAGILSECRSPMPATASCLRSSSTPSGCICDSPELPRRRGPACGARTGHQLRDGAPLGWQVRWYLRPRTPPQPWDAVRSLTPRRDGGADRRRVPEHPLVLVFGRRQDQDRGVADGLQREPTSHIPGVQTPAECIPGTGSPVSIGIDGGRSQQVPTLHAIFMKLCSHASWARHVPRTCLRSCRSCRECPVDRRQPHQPVPGLAILI